MGAFSTTAVTMTRSERSPNCQLSEVDGIASHAQREGTAIAARYDKRQAVHGFSLPNVGSSPKVQAIRHGCRTLRLCVVGGRFPGRTRMSVWIDPVISCIELLVGASRTRNRATATIFDSNWGAQNIHQFGELRETGTWWMCWNNSIGFKSTDYGDPNLLHPLLRTGQSSHERGVPLRPQYPSAKRLFH